jgi:predicted ATP-dependent serine protease
MAGSDENSVKDNQPVLIQLRKICEDTNSAIILLHHSNRQGTMRGSTSIPGSLNSALKIESEVGSSTIKITTDKMRDSKPFTKIAKIVYVDKENDPNQIEYFYITQDDDTPFDEVKTDREKTDREKSIIDYMKANNNDLILVDFLKTVPKSESESYRRDAYRLRDKGTIVKNLDKSEKNKTVFSIA